MPYLTTNDGVKLYYEDSGAGRPMLFIHEFSGDYRAWELQVRYFARRYRCITYNARGYPPSDVPDSVEKYSQRRAIDDAVDVLNYLEIDKAHIVGLSMGALPRFTSGLTILIGRSVSSWVPPAWAPSRTRRLSFAKKSRSWQGAGKPRAQKSLRRSTALGPAASNWR